MKKTFAQLKRDLQVGKKIKCLVNNCRDNFEKEEREILRKQTNAITLKTLRNGEYVESCIYYPNQADMVEYEDNVFSFYEKTNRWNDNKRTLLYTYEIIED